MSDKAAPAPPSRAAALKIVATVLVIGGALVVLLTASMSKAAEYYKFVDEVMANTDSFRGKKLQVHGVVADGSIEQAKGTLMYRFKIQSRPDRPAASIVANYEGLVPDTFKSGAEVIVRGSLTADNQINVIPDGIMAKCPSKYNADEQDKKDRENREKQPAGNVAQQLKVN
ncbi:MAG TPA: cytochrome c maturation protein CcmE [Polyangia bacterium]|nr:cytochrome c maturation protein CcmE [Polyangia bacterium]